MPFFLLAGGLSPGDILNGSVALVVGIGGIAASIVIFIVSRRGDRNDAASFWETRATELTNRLELAHQAELDQLNERITERDERIAALEATNKGWLDRWMGAPKND